MSRIALATCAEFPDLDEDGPLLLDALARAGHRAQPAIWDDPAQDWAGYDVVVVRGTWDYHLRRDEFLAWARAVAGVTRLANPAPALEWNTDKRYLRELEATGLPVVATRWIEPGDDVELPERGEFVVKPSVSAGSKDTNRWRAGEHDSAARAHVERLLAAGRTAMVQPYLRAVDSDGETALLFAGGRFSHAIRKGPLLTPAMEFVAGAYAPETITARSPTAEQLDVAERVLAALPWPPESLTYARVDLVPGSDGAPLLLELELTEPSLFLQHDAGAAQRLVAAVGALVG